MQCKHFLPLVLTFIVLLPAVAQEIRVNERGEKIIVNPDGTWQYFTNFGVSSDALFDPQDVPGYQPKETNSKYPVFNGTVLPMNNVYVNTEEDARKIFIRRAQIAQEAAAVAEKRAIEAKQNRQNLEREWQEAQEQKLNEEIIRTLNIRLTAARKTEQETAQEVVQARQEAAKADQLTSKGNYLNELVQSSKTRANTQPQNGEALDDDFYRNVLLLDEASGRTRTTASTCQIAYEGKDESSGQIRKDVQEQLLFTYTDERLRSYLKDKEYLKCEGFLTGMGGYRFLSLKFTFAYPNAREAYGFIEQGSILIVKQLDGSFVSLPALRMDKGSYDTETELLTYSVHYPIDRSQLNLLRRGELDSVIMFWSSGYEEYPVYNVNFFANQISCLEK
ncbi:MAG: hypothetical protein ACK4TA_04920 [Saprospiraceae bacterium]